MNLNNVVTFPHGQLLQQRLMIPPMPIGSVYFLPVDVDYDFPGWLRCEGQELKRSDYPLLYEACKISIHASYLILDADSMRLPFMFHGRTQRSYYYLKASNQV